MRWRASSGKDAAEAGQMRLWGRELADYMGRYPEMDALGKLHAGTASDRERTVFRHSRADLDAVLRLASDDRPVPDEAGQPAGPGGVV